MAGEKGPQGPARDSALALMQAAVSSNISLFDQKCSILMGLDTAAAVYCVNSITDFSGGVSVAVQLQTWADWSLAVLAFVFFVSAVFAISVVWPRTGKSKDDPLFWNIWPKARARSTFVLPIDEVPTAEWQAAEGFHIGLLGNICRQKLKWFRVALFLAIVGFSGLAAVEIVRFTPEHKYFVMPAHVPVNMAAFHR